MANKNNKQLKRNWEKKQYIGNLGAQENARLYRQTSEYNTRAFFQDKKSLNTDVKLRSVRMENKLNDSTVKHYTQKSPDWRNRKTYSVKTSQTTGNKYVHVSHGANIVDRYRNSKSFTMPVKESRKASLYNRFK